MSNLNNEDKKYFSEKFKKIQYENKLLLKKNHKELNSLINIKRKQSDALEKIFEYLNNIILNNKLSTSEIAEIREDELELLKELENLKKFTKNIQ